MDCKFYKSCAVPMCRSSSIKTPGKLFVFVPQRTGLRKEWFRLAKRVKPLRSQKTYFCEDHFDMPNDMLNYMQYHVTGSVSRIHMRPGCLPSRFDCQTDGQPADVCQPAAVKRQRDDEGARDDRTLTVECDNENDTTSCSDVKQERRQSTEVPRHDDSAGAASESGGCKKIKIEESQERMEADEESDVARLLHCEIEIKQEADSDDGV